MPSNQKKIRDLRRLLQRKQAKENQDKSNGETIENVEEENNTGNSVKGRAEAAKKRELLGIESTISELKKKNEVRLFCKHQHFNY